MARRAGWDDNRAETREGITKGLCKCKSMSFPAPRRCPEAVASLLSQMCCMECRMVSVCVSPCFIWRPLPRTNYSSEICARFKRFSSSRFSWEEAVFLCRVVQWWPLCRCSSHPCWQSELWCQMEQGCFRSPLTLEFPWALNHFGNRCDPLGVTDL